LQLMVAEVLFIVVVGGLSAFIVVVVGGRVSSWEMCVLGLVE